MSCLSLNWTSGPVFFPYIYMYAGAKVLLETEDNAELRISNRSYLSVTWSNTEWIR